MVYQQEAPMEVYPVRMTARHAREARKNGHGNLSLGVRLAIEKIEKPANSEKEGPVIRELKGY